MRNKLFFIIWLLAACTTRLVAAEPSNVQDSLKAKAIDKEAESNDFIHCYLLLISEGKSIFSTFGHASIRMVCPSKQLDYCFTFEMNMEESSYLDVYNRKAKAGFVSVPSNVFLDSYRKEGRGITSAELNLTPKEKQNLWRELDREVGKGATWAFDFTTINCLSMTLYIINKAIAPSEVKFKKLPCAVYESLDKGIDYVTEQSPWGRIGMHLILRNVDNSQVKAEDLLTPLMAKDVLPYTYIASTAGNRPFMKGHTTTLVPKQYHDKPFWLTPTMALSIVILLIIAIIVWIYYKRNNHNSFIKKGKI